jgi:GNAT superfamily N-acetyltransferase
MISRDIMLDDHLGSSIWKTKQVLEDLSTAAGSDASSSDGSSCYGGQDRNIGFFTEDTLQSCTEDESESVSDEEEEGADEEAEFSLDGRLATIKRWRAFRAREAQAHAESVVEGCEEFSIYASSSLALPPCTPPGLPCASSSSSLALPACTPPGLLCASSRPPALGPPGLHGATDEAEARSEEEDHLDVTSLSIIRIEASRLMESGVLWLEQQIRALSREALGVDAWESLSNPSPDDPEWQMLALVGKGCFVGFCTYAFFEEDVGSIMSVHHLLISKNYRGKGCGHRLVMELFQKAQDDGAWAVKLYSRPDAIEFYRRFGFSLVGAGDLMEYRLPVHESILCQEGLS